MSDHGVCCFDMARSKKWDSLDTLVWLAGGRPHKEARKYVKQKRKEKKKKKEQEKEAGNSSATWADDSGLQQLSGDLRPGSRQSGAYQDDIDLP